MFRNHRSLGESHAEIADPNRMERKCPGDRMSRETLCRRWESIHRLWKPRKNLTKSKKGEEPAEYLKQEEDGMA